MNKGFSEIVVVIIFALMCVVAFLIFRSSKLNNNDVTSSPAPRSTRNIVYGLEPSNFIENGAMEELKSFYNHSVTSDFKPFECLQKDIGNFKEDKLPNDENIIYLHEYLTNFDFSVVDGGDSKRDFNYSAFCRVDNNYFTLIDAWNIYTSNMFVKDAHAAGGLPSPSMLVVMDENRDVSVFDRGQITKNFIKVNTRTIGSVAYFGCHSLYGVEGNALLIGCGGGDACCSASGIFKFNWSTGQTKNLVACSNFFESEENFDKRYCYDDRGNKTLMAN